MPIDPERVKLCDWEAFDWGANENHEAEVVYGMVESLIQALSSEVE